jgi:hypothetical protein
MSAVALLQNDVVEADLTYLVPSGEKPFSYNFLPPPPGQPQRSGRYEPQRVAIRDARPIAWRLSLDRQGFALQRHVSRVTDFYDEPALSAIYYPEIESLVKSVTGASKVVVFDHTLRNGSDSKAAGIREPVQRVHNDYTVKSGPQRVRDLLPAAEAEALLQHRFAVINVWRPIRGPVLRSPLALCDAESMSPQDFIANDLIYRDRIGETYAVAHSPWHRWFYFPDMQTDEVVLIKCYDSDTSRARFTAHTAFEDPTAPANAPPRESIEIRTLAFFAPDGA